MAGVCGVLLQNDPNMKTRVAQRTEGNINMMDKLRPKHNGQARDTQVWLKTWNTEELWSDIIQWQLNVTSSDFLLFISTAFVIHKKQDKM